MSRLISDVQTKSRVIEGMSIQVQQKQKLIDDLSQAHSQSKINQENNSNTLGHIGNGDTKSFETPPQKIKVPGKMLPDLLTMDQSSLEGTVRGQSKREKLEQQNKQKEEEVKRNLRREMMLFNFGIVLLLLTATLTAAFTVCQNRDCL